MKIGTDVPWNAMWSGETTYEIRRCRFAYDQLALWQVHIPGAGKPVFAKPHIVRQRRSIFEMRCTVCGDKTFEGDRWWFEMGYRRSGYLMTTEAPVHRRCADLAVEVCPNIRKQGLSPQRFPPGHRVLAAVITPEHLMEEYGLSASAPVVGQLKLAWREDLVEVRKPVAM